MDENLTRNSSQSSCSNNEKVANTIDTDESHKLLLQLDDDDDNNDVENDTIDVNDKCTSRNQANRKSGHNDNIEFDLANALVSPTNPFRLDLIQFERCQRSTVAESTTVSMKPINKAQHESVDTRKTDGTIDVTNIGTNQNNDIKYQRNSKSLGFLLLCKRVECNCSSNSSCNCLSQGNSLNLRRTKSSTGINHCKWSNEIDDMTHLDEAVAMVDGTINKSCINSMAANNDKITNSNKTATKTSTIHSINARHSSNGNSKRNNSKELAEIRFGSTKLSPQPKPHYHQTEKTAETKINSPNCVNKTKAKHSCDGINDTKSNNNKLQANSSKINKSCASNGHRNNNMIVNNNADIFSTNSKADAGKTMVRCESAAEHTNQSLMPDVEPLTGEHWNSNDNAAKRQCVSGSIIEKWSSHEHDLLPNATNTSTNPFLEHATNVAESRISKNANGKGANCDDKGNQMERCDSYGVKAQRNDSNGDDDDDDEIHASNDVEETIPNQFITNDDKIPTKPKRLNASSDNERNISENGKREPHYNESYLSRTKRQQKHDRISNNLLEYENENGDSNQWDGAARNRSATLMKYGNKKRRRKDAHKDVRKHNHQSSDNLSLIDGNVNHQMRYAEPNTSNSRTYWYDKNLKHHADAEHSSQKNLNYFNELDQQLINDDKQHRQPISYTTYAKNRPHILNAISDIPTCPFQRQDYTEPDNENHIPNSSHVPKKSKKDLLLEFAMQKGKYLSNTITRSGSNESANDCNGIRKTGNYVQTVNISSNSISSGGATTRTLTSTATITHGPSKSTYLKRFNVAYANRLASTSNAKQQQRNALHFRHKDDKTYFDKTKKSLLKIGQKCGLKLNNSLSVGIPVKKYATSSLREPLTGIERDAHGYRHSGHINRPIVVEKVPYKSYRSEMDLTKNLHYLDAFLNENFDKLSQPKGGSHSIGKYSMRSSSRDRKSLNAMAYNEFPKRAHRHRAQSFSEVSEFDTVDDSYTFYGNTAAAALSINDTNTTMENSLENNYKTTSSMSSASQSKHRDFSANGANNSVEYRASSINDNLNSMGQHHQANLYAISSSTSESFSFKQQSMSNQSPNQSIQQQPPSTGQCYAKFTLAKDSQQASNNQAHVFASSSCERSAKSHTTSSSLSSSDYASVYSPNSEKHYQTQTPMANNELSFKRKRYPPIGAQYPKRKSLTTGHDLMYDDQLTATNYLNDTRPLKCIDGPAPDTVDTDTDDDDDDVPGENVANNFNDFNECSNYARNISQSDKLQLLEKSLYQFENKLPHHEDYLQHYYSKSGAHRKSTSNVSMQIQSSMPWTTLTLPYSQPSHLMYAQSTLNLPSGSTHPYYAHEVSIRNQPNYPQNRVVITKQKNNHSNTNDIVLEYEC